jgi:hypothetical protein
VTVGFFDVESSSPGPVRWGKLIRFAKKRRNVEVFMSGSLWFPYDP